MEASPPSAAVRSDVPAEVGSRPSTGVSRSAPTVARAHCLLSPTRSAPPALCALLLTLSYQVEMRADSLLVVGFTISGRSGVGGAPLPQMLAEVGGPTPGLLRLAERASRRGNSKLFIEVELLFQYRGFNYKNLQKKKKKLFKIKCLQSFLKLKIFFFICHNTN